MLVLSGVSALTLLLLTVLVRQTNKQTNKHVVPLL